MNVREREGQAGIRCAYCHGEREGVMDTCSDCGTVLHPGCHRELGACSTLGCAAERVGPGEIPALQVKALALASSLGGAAAAIQGVLLTRHSRTPSDVVALLLVSALSTTALGIWLGRWTCSRVRGASSATQALPLAAFLGAGLALSSSALLRGVWLVAASALLVCLRPRSAAAPPQ